MFEKFFKLREYNTTVQAEVVAGLTTFLAMAYIIFVNPNILSTTGMDKGAIIVSTCVAAAFGCFVMAFWANWPVGLAPGMGLNAFFAFTVVQGMGWTWQAALGAVFISGCVFVILTLTGVRKWIVEAIPESLQVAIPAGIGLFLGFIALRSAGVIAKNDATLITLGDMHQLSAIFAVIGFFMIVALDYFKVRGSILLGILAVTALGVAFDPNVQMPGVLMSVPPSIAPTFMQLDVIEAWNKGIFNVVLVFVLVEIFDATGVLTGVAKRAGLINRPGGINHALGADSVAILSGSVLGTSSTTAYIESMAGIQAGGRTGMTAMTIGLLFLCALFFSPLIAMVPAYATAPALVYVAGLMLAELTHVKWTDVSEAVPAALTVFAMPFTFSIANGLAFGFISFTVLKLLTKQWKVVHPAAWVIAVLFMIRFIFFLGH